MITFRKKNKDNSILAAVDVGSSKIACLIAKKEHSKNKYEVLGIGQQLSKGFNAGTVTDIDKLATCVGKAISSAEKMAGISVKEANIIINGGQQTSKTFSSSANLTGLDITEKDIQKVVKNCIHDASQFGRTILHAIPVNFKLDNSSPIRNPIGMIGKILYADVNICSIRESAIQNIAKVIERNHININQFISSSLANGSGCLLQEEMDLGASIVDLGSSTSSVSIFMESSLVYSFEIPIGGLNISKDIASGLSISLNEAEKIKVLHGNLFNSSFQSNENINIQILGEDASPSFQSVSVGLINEIIKARISEIFELIRDHLNNTPYSHIAISKTVFTGGGSLLTGLDEIATEYLTKYSRIAKPKKMNGLPDGALNAYFSSLIGSFYTDIINQDNHLNISNATKAQKNLSSFNKIYQWLATHV